MEALLDIVPDSLAICKMTAIHIPNGIIQARPFRLIPGHMFRVQHFRAAESAQDMVSRRGVKYEPAGSQRLINLTQGSGANFKILRTACCRSGAPHLGSWRTLPVGSCHTRFLGYLFYWL